MHFNKYQKFVKKYSFYPKKGHNISYPALGIAGEGGEVCDKIKKILRDSKGRVSKDDKRFIKKNWAMYCFILRQKQTNLN